LKKLLFLIPLFLVSCSSDQYASKKQAYAACKEWEAKGDKVKYTFSRAELIEPLNLDVDKLSLKNYKLKYIDAFHPIRFCELEKETNQYLGSIYNELKEFIEPSKFLGGLYYKINRLDKPSFNFTHEYEIKKYLKQTKIIKNFKY
tara:strand:+ start:44 stop:478 length:435 start_codon:yes stop_codon:yes gene_type:complete